MSKENQAHDELMQIALDILLKHGDLSTEEATKALNEWNEMLVQASLVRAILEGKADMVWDSDSQALRFFRTK